MTKIKFGTDGWRAIIAREFTTANVERVAYAAGLWLNQNNGFKSVTLGHDCRFAGALFADCTAKVLGGLGIKVFMAKGYVSTPMVSLGTVNHKTGLGIIITASHNPPEYNGFKLKGSYGGPLFPSLVEEIENLIPLALPENFAPLSLNEMEAKGLLVFTDLETEYCQHVEQNFDLELIRNSGIRIGYDAMYGAGQNVVRRLLPGAFLMHCDYNPSFHGQAPEPIHKNLLEFSEYIRASGKIDCGLVTDGDADRIGFYNSKGEFVDSHHIILLLIHYLHKVKGLHGKICTAFSSTRKISVMCKAYGLPLEIVKIGFKYIGEIMSRESVMVGGEESGGIAIAGHIPERDGIWIGLTLIEFMAKSGKSLDQLIEEVYAITGSFAFERNDLHIAEERKKEIIEGCRLKKFKSFGSFHVTEVQDLDGFKHIFENGDWLMMRASGTEPLLRLYAESSTREGALKILAEGRKTLGLS